jgi:ABC-2 type transport system permease protein
MSATATTTARPAGGVAAPGAAPATRRADLTGTGRLVRFTLRRDRVRALVWVLGIVSLVLVNVPSIKGLYPTQADLDSAAASFGDNAAARALNGPAYALDTLGGQVVFQVGAFGLVVVGLMSLFMVGRLTRGEEESGRTELIRSMAVGRHAPAAAALVVVVGMNLVAGALVALGLVAQGLPAAGSVALGASYVAFGLFMAALTTVAAQVTENTRVVYGIAGAVLGYAYVVRAAGDAGDGTLSWLSPIGWSQKVRAFAGEEWWPLLIGPVLALGLLVLAAELASRRDLGGGLVPPRPGPPVAAPSLGTPLGLAVRLQRGSVIGWAVGVLLTGVSYGSIADDVEDLLNDSDAVEEMLARAGGDIVESYLSTALLVIALIGAGFAVQAALRLRGEEEGARAEALLATPVSRAGWVASHVAVALAGSLVVLLAGGLGTAVTYGLVADDLGAVPRLVGSALAYAPAVWVLVGVAVALFGLVPRAAVAVWGLLAFCFLVGMLSEVLDLPGWVTALSPFEHVPLLPAADLEVVPLVTLTAIAAGLIAVGLAGFRRRDLASSA